MTTLKIESGSLRYLGVGAGMVKMRDIELYCKNLRSIYLSSSGGKVSARDVANMLQYCTELEDVVVEENIDGRIASRLFSHLPHLRFARLARCEGNLEITSGTLEHLEMRRCKHLKTALLKCTSLSRLGWFGFGPSSARIKSHCS